MKKLLSLFIVTLLFLGFNSSALAASNGLLPVKSGSTTVKIEKAQATSKPKKLELRVGTKTIYVGDDEYENRVDPYVTYQNGSVLYTAPEDVKLSSSNTKVLAVESAGYLVPKAAGKATINGTYKGLKASVSITVKSVTSGEFSIEFKGTENVDYANTSFNYVKKYGSKKTDYYYTYANLKSTQTSNGFKFTNVNWEKYSKVYGTITTNGKVYYVEVTKKDNKKTITLDPSQLKEVTIKYPNSDVVTGSLSISKRDANKKPYYAGGVYGVDKFYVPKGTYSLHIEAKDTKNYYNIFLTNQSINSDKEIVVSSSSLALATFKVKETGSNSLALQNVSSVNFDYFDVIGSLTIDQAHESSAPVYLSKMTYEDINASVLVNTKWYYYYKFASNKVTGNKTYTIGDQLTASISFNKKYKLYAGSRVFLPAYGSGTGSLKIKDQYGNYVTSIYGEDYRQKAEGVLVFKGSKKTYRMSVSSLNYGQVTLPSVPGTYKVTFELKTTSN